VRSLDGPTCPHGRCLFDPTRCNECEEDNRVVAFKARDGEEVNITPRDSAGGGDERRGDGSGRPRVPGVCEEGRAAAVMSFWAIRQASTGSYLPLFQGRQTRGFTHAEPDDFLPPRLFGTPNSARVALTWWLRGPVRYVTSHFMDEPELVRDVEHTDRDGADFEVVRVELRPCG
jgi:hypothetical protein